MKKSLVALAALAAVGAASAQSTVTLYGRVDASIGSSKNTVTGVSTTSQFNGSAGGLTGSRWGITGTEDLGGGLKAVFKLENRFNVDTGTDNGAWMGDAYVGLTGGFGTVHLGRSYSAFFTAKTLSATSAVWDATGFAPTAFGSDGPVPYTVRADNQIKYVSPTFSGVSATLTKGFKESTNAGAKDTNGVTVSYAMGGLSLAASAQSDAAGKQRIVSGAYNFGVASVSGGYGTLDGINNGNDGKGYTLGVAVPLGAFSVSLAYADGETETNAGAKVSDYSSVGAGVRYALSKRTTLYAGYKETKIKNAAGVKTSGTRVYATGVRHDF